MCSHLKRQLASSKCCCCILSDLPMCSAQLDGAKIEVDSTCNWHSGQGEPTLRPQIQQRRRGEMPPGCIKIATVQCTSVHPVHSASVCIPCQGIYHLEHLALSPRFASPDKMLSTALIARRTVRKLLGRQSLWLMHSVRIPYVRIAHQNSRMQYQISTLRISMIMSIFYHWPIHW